MRKLFVVLAAALPLVFVPAAQADVITYNPAEDAWTSSATCSGTSTTGPPCATQNRGADSDDELWSMSSGPTERSFLEFNVANLPPGSTVNSATLTLRTSGKSYSNSSNGPRLHDSGCFDENTVTHSNAPTAGLQLANYGNWTANSSITVDVPVPGNGVYCYSLEGDSTDDLGVWSSEAPTSSNRPVLRIDYTPGTPPPPTAGFTFSPSNPVHNDTISFNGSSTVCPAAPCTYRYHVDDVTFATTQNWSGAFSQGNYVMVLTVTDSLGRTDDDTKTITVAPPPAQPQCSDGVNNDPAEDSLVDFPADPGCSSATDNSESPNPPPPPQCSDGVNNDPGEDNNVDFPADLGCSSSADTTESPNPPPSGTDPLPPGLTPVAAGTQEWNGTGSFTTSQCPHAIPYMTEGSTTFARFQRNPGEPQSAGGYRCEQQSSTYIQKGIYWFQWRARYPNGYEPSCASWCTMRQWHENTSDGGGPVYLATFMQNGRPQIDGQFVNPGSQNLDVDVRQWHVYTAQVNFNSGTAGWADLWIDGVYSGRTSTNRTATPSNSYDKYGTYGGDSNTTRTADYDWARAYRP
jgi:hypothetical protein